ncbi:MAG: carboxypeptidase regulatory-like domain-containing protein [Gemmatimonadales bacterium]
MRLHRCRALPLGVILLGFTTSLAAQATMSGIVREDSSARPLEGVEVLINGTPHRAITNASGRYLLEGLPGGIYQVIFRTVGHVPVRMDVLLTAGETTRANATLVRSDVVLDPILVTGEPMREVGLAGLGFEERRRVGLGRFIDPAELRESEHLRVVDLLRRHGVTVMPVPGRGKDVYRAYHPTRRNAAGQLNCPMVTYLDGVLVVIDDLRTDIDISALAAVEVYRGGAQLPAQFSGAQAQCGAVVMWTRRGP